MFWKRLSLNSYFIVKKLFFFKFNTLGDWRGVRNLKFNDLFIDSGLPKPLKKEELYDCFEKMKQGDMTAREKIINHNIRLVIGEVVKKYSNTPYDLNELISIGLIGLVKSVDTFDTSKNLQFATYSSRCIINEILMFMRKGKKYVNDVSLELPVGKDRDGNDLRIEDTICDNSSDFVSKYEENEIHTIIRKVVNELPEKDKNIIIKHFGFIDDNPMTQREIADELGLSQSYVSRIIKRILKNISVQLDMLGVTELSLKQENISDEESREGVQEMPKKLQTIYEYFNKYTRDQVDEMLSKLTEEEKILVTLRYGSDLDNPVTSKEWSKENRQQFYGSLIPKMKRLLANQNKVKAVSLQEKDFIRQEQSKTSNQIQTEQYNYTKNISKSLIKENHETLVMEKRDYIRIMDLLKTADFGQMLNILTPKEAIIVCLRFGYVDGKYFSSDSIAEFLGIELDEVIESATKALLLYKNSINEFIDKAVEYTLNNQEINSLNKRKNA